MIFKLPQKAIILLILSALFVLVQSQSTQGRVDSLNDLIDRSATTFLSDSRFKGVSIAVYSRGESYLNHYGELDRGMSNLPTDSTLYEIASVTKTMTGYLVAKAVVENRLSLEDSVVQHLGPQFDNLAYEGHPVTIRHLVTHTSGLPLNIEGVSELYEDASGRSFERARDLLTRYDKESFLRNIETVAISQMPGESYSYSNVAPNLVAHILETVYREPFQDILQKHLFRPAGMENTKINLPKLEQELLANGYNENSQRMPSFREPINLWGSAGRVKSNTQDMLAFMKFQLNRKNIGVEESHSKLFQDLENLWLGYYWEVIDDDDGTHIEHHGGLYGTQNWLMIYPEFDFGVFVITNTSFPEANSIIKRTAIEIFEGANENLD